MCENKRFHIEELIEGVDFNWKDINGVKARIFTKEYLSIINTRCCQNNCENCPWEPLKKRKNP